MSSGVNTRRIRTSQMSSSSLPPLHLEFARAPVRDGLCVLILLITIAVPTLAVIDYGLGAITITVLAAASLAAYIHWRAGWLGNKYRVGKAVWDGEGQWWLTLAGESRIGAELCPESVATRFGAWLVFRTEQGDKRFLLVTFATFPALYRALLVRLRIDGIEAAAPQRGDEAHVRAYFPRSLANFRSACRSTRALMELPWPRATRGETRRP